MNIFYTDHSPIVSANQHCKVHMNKMISESCQMLSTCHHVVDAGQVPEGLFSMAYENHPCSVWVRSSLQHYNWLLEMTKELCRMYEIDRGYKHACDVDRLWILEFAPRNLKDNGFTEPPQCMFDHCMGEDTCKAYHNYLNEKFLDWTTRTDKKRMPVEFLFGKPEWLTSC